MIGTLPLTNNPEESFNIVILDEVFIIRQLWNTYGFWTIDISDADGNILVYGIKLVAGIYITKQYPGIPFDLLIDTNADPGRFDLEKTIVGIYEK